MSEEDLLHLAPAHMLIMEHSATRIEVPPPPAAVDEAPAMWKPEDRPQDIERIPLANEEEREVAAVMGIWLGLQALEISKPDPKVREEPRRREDDEEEDTEE